MVRIPSEYQEVEWVQGQSCNIDLQYIPQIFPTVIATFSIENGTDGDLMGFPENITPSFIIDSVCTTSSQRWYNRYYNTSSQTFSPVPELSRKDTWEFGRIVKYYNQSIVAMIQTEQDWSINTQSFHLFGARNNHHGLKVYDFKLFDGNNLVRNLIPCYRKSDNEPGMYDTVTGTFYTNSGTGSFTVGNDVSYSTTNLTETRRKIILNSPHIESASGNICTFSTDMTAKLKSCRVNFLPKQAGSGDPSPDNVRAISGCDGVEFVRCGKNLYNQATDTVDAFIRANNPVGEIETNRTGYHASDYIRVKPNTTYTVNYNVTSNASAAGMVFYSNNDTDSIIGSISLYSQIPEAGGVKYYTFTTANNCNYLRFSTSPQSSNVQLEESSQPTPYEPYTAQTLPVTFPAQGNNLFDLKWLLTSDGSITDGVLTDSMYKLMQSFGTATGGMPNTDYESQIAISITAKNGQEYTDTGRGFTIKVVYDDETEGTLVYFSNTVTDFTTVTGVSTAGKKVAKLYLDYGSGGSNVWDIKDIMIVKGSTAQAYEPYDNTIYGGYLDLTSGELWANMICLDMGEMSWSKSNDLLFRTFGSTLPAEPKTYPRYYMNINWLCSRYKIGTVNSEPQSDKTMCCTINSSTVILKDSDFETAAELKSALDGAQFAYELATPQLIATLTPTQIKTLKGINNVYSDANDVTDVNYWTHGIHERSYTIAYEARNLTFDGSNYIDTGVYLFSQDNIDRDFEVRIVGIQGDYTNSATQTLVCAKHNGNGLGFLIRPSGNTERQYNGTIFIQRNTLGTITIRRVNGVLSCDGTIITNQPVPFATNTVFNWPLMLGCAVDDDGSRYRYCAGSIDHIVVLWLS